MFEALFSILSMSSTAVGGSVDELREKLVAFWGNF